MSHRSNTSTTTGLPPLRSERTAVAWSNEDDELLLSCRGQGMNWGPIASNNFPSKTPNACRKRYERLQEKRQATDDGKLEEVARAYMECREEMWKLVAERTNKKWQAVEAQCMKEGVKTLQTISRGRKRAHSSSPTSPRNDENDPHDDHNDSGLGPDITPHKEGGHHNTSPQQPPSSLGGGQSSYGGPSGYTSRSHSSSLVGPSMTYNGISSTIGYPSSTGPYLPLVTTLSLPSFSDTFDNLPPRPTASASSY